MTRLFLVVATLSAMTVVPLAIGQHPGPDTRTVTVKGQGADETEALNDALRKAVETGGELKLYAESETQNYELVRDTILAQASGLIREYKILRKGPDPIGGYFVEIEAVVDRKLIDATWGQVEILLRRIGRPKILVAFVERIHEQGHPEVVDAASLLGNKIEELLVKKGFALVDKDQINQLKQDAIQQAAMANDTAALGRLAKELGAAMYLVGNSRASGPQVTDAYGVPLYMWETDVTLKAFWSETAGILFADSQVGDRGGSRTPGPPGAKQALAKSGEKLAFRCLAAILQNWSKVANSGGTVVIEVKNLDFRQAMAIQKTLQRVKGVQEVRRQFQKPVGKFELVTTDSAETFVEKLTEMDFGGFGLDIEDQRFNTITASISRAPPQGESPPADETEESPPQSAPPVQPPPPAAAQPVTTQPASSAPATQPAS